MYLLSYSVIYYVTMIHISLPHLDRLEIATLGKPMDIHGLKRKKARQMSPVLSAGQGVSIRMWWEPGSIDASTNQRSRPGATVGAFSATRATGTRCSKAQAVRVPRESRPASLGPPGPNENGSSFRHGRSHCRRAFSGSGWCCRPGGRDEGARSEETKYRSLS